MNRDGKEEIIVAYYTSPHDYWIEKDGKKVADERFYDRARVAIFEIKKMWESKGYGNLFDINFLPTTLKKEKIEYPWYVFGAKDIDGDGFLELIFSRTEYTAMRGVIEIWRWNGKEFTQKLITDGELLFQTTEKDLEVVSISYYAGEITEIHYTYDKSLGKYKIKSQFTKVLSDYMRENTKGK
ncbi:MAG TPA: hypothetical protein PK165_03390 [bacterium]|nr:hypothetical protein [bacterium]HPO51860.1 hypothetical protein [bacterium]